MSSHPRSRSTSGSSRTQNSSSDGAETLRGKSPLLIVGQVVFAATVLAAPWAFAGVPTVVQFWLVVAGLAAISIWWLHLGIAGLSTVRIPVAFFPLAMAILLGALQLVPLSGGVAEILAPAQTALRQAMGTLPEPLSAAAQNTPEYSQNTISLNPSATKHDLSLMVLGVTIFVLSTQFFRSRSAYLWFLTAVSINGVCFVLMGIVQRMIGEGKIYGVWEASHDAIFATFVNENNGGNYLNLCLAAALGVTIWVFGQRPVEARKGGPVIHKKQTRYEKFHEDVRRFFAELSSVKLASLTACGIIAGGVLCTLSRGAVMAIVIGLVATLLFALLTRRRGAGIWGLAVVLLLGVGLTAWVGMTEPLAEELATLENADSEMEVRFNLWQDSLQTFPEYWRFGSGLGTFRYVYRAYFSIRDRVWFYHAENEFVEALVETGLPGLILMAAALFLIYRACFVLLRKGSSSRDLAIGVAGTFAITTQLVDSMFDFALHIPANMILFAAICGGVCVHAHFLAIKRQDKSTVRIALTGSYAFAVVFLLFGGLLLGAFELKRRSELDQVVRDIDLHRESNEWEISSLDERIRTLESVVRPANDAEGYLELAELWIERYRLMQKDRILKNNPVGTETLDELLIKELTSLREFHAKCYRARLSDSTVALKMVLGDENVSENLYNAAYYLKRSRNLSPVIPNVHLRLAELSAVSGNLEDDKEHLRRTLVLAPMQANLLREAGFLDFQGGRTELACQRWRKAMELDPTLIRPIMTFAKKNIAVDIILAHLLPHDAQTVYQIAKQHFVQPEDVETYESLVQRVESLLADGVHSDAETFYLKARIALERDSILDSLDLYEKALMREPTESNWRYEFAELLYKQGEIDRAVDEVRRCVLQAPDNQRYRKLQEQIVTAKYDQRSL